MRVGLVLIRLVVGLTLASHGTQKLFGWFGGPGLKGAAKFMESVGFTPGRRSALLAGLTETGAGLLFALGLLTPVAAAGLLGAMLVAASANSPNGFFVQKGGYEYTLVLGLVALGIAFTGPGSLSGDGLLGLELRGSGWGFGAAIVGALGAAFQLASRRRPASRPF
jgi:putative oxidoreductase